jgi:hypothetical protein
MDEMRGDISGSASGFTSGSAKAFFFQCLVSVGISDHGANGSSDALLLELFLFGATLSGVMSFELIVEAFTASL